MYCAEDLHTIKLPNLWRDILLDLCMISLDLFSCRQRPNGGKFKITNHDIFRIPCHFSSFQVSEVNNGGLIYYHSVLAALEAQGIGKCIRKQTWKSWRWILNVELLVPAARTKGEIVRNKERPDIYFYHRSLVRRGNFWILNLADREYTYPAMFFEVVSIRRSRRRIGSSVWRFIGLSGRVWPFYIASNTTVYMYCSEYSASGSTFGLFGLTRSVNENLSLDFSFGGDCHYIESYANTYTFLGAALCRDMSVCFICI